MKKEIILLLPHCLLNSRVRAEGLGREGTEEIVLGYLSRYSLPLFQLPCPEYLFIGRREKMTYDEYRKLPGYEDFLNKLAISIRDYLRSIPLSPLVLGIRGSPSCSLSLVKGKEGWREGEGLFIRALKKTIAGIFLEVDYDDLEKSLRELDKWLRGE